MSKSLLNKYEKKVKQYQKDYEDLENMTVKIVDNSDKHHQTIKRCQAIIKNNDRLYYNICDELVMIAELKRYLQKRINYMKKGEK